MTWLQGKLAFNCDLDVGSSRFLSFIEIHFIAFISYHACLTLLNLVEYSSVVSHFFDETFCDRINKLVTAVRADLWSLWQRSSLLISHDIISTNVLVVPQSDSVRGFPLTRCPKGRSFGSLTPALVTWFINLFLTWERSYDGLLVVSSMIFCMSFWYCL